MTEVTRAPSDPMYGRFRITGDGARYAVPDLEELHRLGYPKGLKPSKLTKATCRKLIDFFLDYGRSNHGPGGTTLWVFYVWGHDSAQPLRMEEHSVYVGGKWKPSGFTVFRESELQQA